MTIALTWDAEYTPPAMVRINKIYTRTGDDGTTSLVDGSRVPKNHPRVQAFGELDEVNALLGVVRTYAVQPEARPLRERIAVIQSELFDIGSYLAAPAGFDKFPLFKVTDAHIKRLEQWIDDAIDGLPALTSFVLPGGTPINAHLHTARAVSRRAERQFLDLAKSEKVNPLVGVYLNRLSDLLFAWAREESHRAKIDEFLWEPATKREK